MAQTFIWKPSTINSWKRGIAFLAPAEGTREAPFVTDSSGKRYEARFINTNEGRHQWVFDPSLAGMQDLTLNYGGQQTKIGQGARSYEGGELGGWQERDKGSLGDTSGVSGGYPGQFTPGNIGYGAYPAYLGGQFPDPTFADFDPIKKKIPFKYTDPFEFSQKYGEMSRAEVSKNADLAKELALDQVATELQGLESFIPAASALKRQELSLDNQFNQAQRTGQLREIFPDLDARFGGIRSDLEEQGRRAEIYASGRAPDEITDRGLELTARSRAADRANASGFGGQAATRVSDLMSAEMRLGIAQYGENLLGGNIQGRSGLINQEAALRLAPTQYSDAGAQVRVTPSFSPGQAQMSNMGQLNQISMLSASQAFAGEVGQQQFISQQEFARRQFNKTGRFQESQINAGIANQFAMSKFAYDVGYAGTLAGAAQTDINTGVALDQQAQANEASQQAQQQAQDANEIGAIATGIGAIASAIPSIVGAFTGGGGAPSYEGSGAIQVGGGSYEPGTNYGAQEGSIVVPQGQPVPAGYRQQRRTSNGSVIAVPIGGSQGGAPIQGPSQGPSSGGPAPVGSPSYNGGQSSEDFGGATSGGGDTPSGPPSGYESGDSVPIPENPNFENDPGYTPVTESDVPPPAPPDYDPAQEDMMSYSRSASSTPTRFNNANLDTFQEDTGINLKPDEGRYLYSQGRDVLSDAGIHYQPSRNANVDAGVDNAGRKLYGDSQKMAVNTPEIGADYVNSFVQTFAPTNVFTPQDRTALNRIAGAAGSAATIAKLNAQWQSGDTKGFINTIGQTFKTPLINTITQNKRDRAGLNAVFSAYNLYQNWDRMSAGQKGLGLASVGLQAFRYSTGEDLASKPIIEATLGSAGEVIKPGLTVGQGLGLFQAGYNVYGMVNNWDDLNTLQKVAQGTQNVASMAQLGQQFGLLGSGTTGAAVSTSAAQLANAGYSAAPRFGVGALIGEAGATVPAGYSSVATLKNGSQVVIPQANASTAAVGPSTLSVATGAVTFALGAKQVYDGWGTGGARGRVNGAVGGSAMAAGLWAMGATNPFLLAAVVAVSVLGNSIKTGKHADQVSRDAVRNAYKNTGLTDNAWNVTLADGSLANIGIDGRGDQHSFTNKDFVTGEHKNIKNLHSYDVDYTNDLDYASSMAGVTLSQLLTGGKATNITQMGGQLGNAAIKNIGYGKEMSRDNFSKMAANQRAFFAQSGIKSKEDAYQLINQGYAEGRWTAADQVSMQQSVNLIFDGNGFDTAQKLMAGRHQGIATAAKNPAKETVTVGPATGSKSPKEVANKIPSGINVDPGFNLPSDTNIDPGFNLPAGSFRGAAASLGGRKPPLSLSRDEMRARNSNRYGNSLGVATNG